MAKRVLLVRGGVLGRNSGLGSAHHNLADLLDSGNVPGWQIDSICEYELSPRASPFQRLWKRWFSHPRAVKKAINASLSNGSCDMVHITDQEQAHLIPKRCKLPVIVTVHDRCNTDTYYDNGPRPITQYKMVLMCLITRAHSGTQK